MKISKIKTGRMISDLVEFHIAINSENPKTIKLQKEIKNRIRRIIRELNKRLK